MDSKDENRRAGVELSDEGLGNVSGGTIIGDISDTLEKAGANIKKNVTGNTVNKLTKAADGVVNNMAGRLK